MKTRARKDGKRLGPERHQDVDHQRSPDRHLAVVWAKVDDGSDAEHPRLHRRARHEGLRDADDARQDEPAREPHRRDRALRRARPRSRTCCPRSCRASAGRCRASPRRASASPGARSAPPAPASTRPCSPTPGPRRQFGKPDRRRSSSSSSSSSRWRMRDREGRDHGAPLRAPEGARPQDHAPQQVSLCKKQQRRGVALEIARTPRPSSAATASCSSTRPSATC
jgi:hypothetical protein